MSILGKLIRENPDKLTINVFIIGSLTMGNFKNLGTIGNLNKAYTVASGVINIL